MKLSKNIRTIALEEGGTNKNGKNVKQNENMKNGELFSWRTDIGIKEYQYWYLCFL